MDDDGLDLDQYEQWLEELAYGASAPRSVLEMPAGYRVDYVPCEFGVYWHLYSGAERVNGGLGASRVHASAVAAQNAWVHQHEHLRRPCTGDSDVIADIIRARRARCRRE